MHMPPHAAEPPSPHSHLLHAQVIFFTYVFDKFEFHVGWTNVLYLLVAGVTALAARSYSVFFCMTSFVHYAVYASTYHQRTGIAFGAFKRDALLFKTLALAQAGVQVRLRTPSDPIGFLLDPFCRPPCTRATPRRPVSPPHPHHPFAPPRHPYGPLGLTDTHHASHRPSHQQSIRNPPSHQHAP